MNNSRSQLFLIHLLDKGKFDQEQMKYTVGKRMNLRFTIDNFYECRNQVQFNTSCITV